MSFQQAHIDQALARRLAERGLLDRPAIARSLVEVEGLQRRGQKIGLAEYLAEQGLVEPEVVARLVQGSATTHLAGPAGGSTVIKLPVSHQRGQRLCGCIVERELGRGGMGAVYLGRDEALDRPVAIKVLLDTSGIKRQRFEREARAIAGLDHPGIVKLLRADVVGDMPCLVMEYVEGSDLSERIAAEELTLDARLELLEEVCSAVHAAHTQGIVHRDLKPANVLVGSDGRVRVTDFGLSRDLTRETRLTATGTMLGTPSYMAPEQIRGDGELDAQTDVWALGVILYELLTGERPFRGYTTIDLCHQIMAGTPQRPSRLNPDLTGAHDRVVLKALSKERAGRHGSAEELGEEVSALRALGPRRAPALLVPGLIALTALLGVGLGAAVTLRSDPQGSSGAAATKREPPPKTEVVPKTRVVAKTEVARKTAVAVKTRVAAPPKPKGELDRLLEQCQDAYVRLRKRPLEALAARILDERPDSPWGLLYQARALDLGVQIGQATQVLQRVVARVDSTSPESDRKAGYEAHLLLARLWFAVGRQQMTARAYGEAIALDGTRWEAFTRRGLLGLYSGRKDLADGVCRQDILRGHTQGLRSAEARRNRACLSWDDARDRKRGLTKLQREAGYRQAERLYSSALKLDPDDAEALQLRAWLYRDWNKPSKMNADLDKALAIFRRGPGLVGYFYLLGLKLRGELLRAQGSVATRMRDAMVWAFRRATAENRRHPLANVELGREYLRRAILLRRQGDPRGSQRLLAVARSNLDWARSVNRRCWEAAAWRGRILAEPGQKRNPKLARQELEAALKLAPPGQRQRVELLQAEALARLKAR